MTNRRSTTGQTYMADGCAPLPGAVPWGSGPNFQTGRQTQQAANTTRLLTRYPFGAAFGVTPWSYYNGGPFESQSTRSVEGVTGSGGPVTWVVTINGRELLRPAEDDPSTLPTDRQTVTAQGRTRTRVQAIVEWSTGTGTNEWVCLDVNQGVVFRVFGTVARVFPFYYPSPQRNEESPFTEILTNDLPVPLNEPGIEFSATTVVQASVQTSANRSEGFPGAWQCTAGLTPEIPQVYVPPFARRVQILQSELGPVVPFYEFVDELGRVVGTVSRDPSKRETSLVSVPFGAALLRIPLATPGFASAIFEVSQF